ncbi:SH3 domain-containing protein [Calothrix sp. NIES-3974]|uniref:SH3 domain-containing protein n=1 Tax=Calothrix sp. NIES-3974 TaxID=2005462 RepID=UPI000B5EB8B8|nr:SH3 domain-containing protein [Calothrix sp. NIES-3974]BAZ07516.1 SH3 type 3 domain protein [Calothrix sp. NIES-3974]
MSKSKVVQALMVAAVVATSALPASATSFKSTQDNSTNLSFPRNREGVLVSQRGGYTYACTRDRDGRLNMRSGPGTRFRQVSQVPNGAVVSIVDVTEVPIAGFYWYKISFNNRVGWVRGDFIC